MLMLVEEYVEEKVEEEDGKWDGVTFTCDFLAQWL